MEEWHTPTKPQVSECTTNCNLDRRMTEHSTSDSLDDVRFLGSEATLELYRWNVPLLHTCTQCSMTLHMISFTWPSPALVL